MASETASDLAFPPHDATPASARAERARSVSAELEAIFGTPAPPAERDLKAPKVARSPRPAAAPRTRRFTAAGLGAVGAAALAGIAAGSLLVQPGPHHAKAPAAPSRPLPIDIVQPQLIPEAADAALAAPPPAPERVAERPNPAPIQRHAVRARPRLRAGAYTELRAADHRLRVAYAAAIRAGAPRPVILAERERWASLRRREANPVRLAAAYRSLAEHLDHAAAEARRREARNHRHRFFHPRFAPWWG
ncbi:MAG: hypothetical protein KGO51_11085 [Alphaproteobacteria bacterium]|nr:hypothetical protein [Alphaproteobacteria bacterium]